MIDLLSFQCCKMETFHLYHLAACWGASGRSVISKVLLPTPLTTGPVNPTISQIHPINPAPQVSPNSVIWAAAAHMVFASRKSQDFITPKQVEELENWTGQVSTLPHEAVNVCDSCQGDLERSSGD
jgi:uridine phosphorylase